MNRVSVIIPCYNGENYIDRSISSVYEQDYSQIELIVVDDGSVDKSKEKILAWVEKFEEKKWSLKYVYQENRGLGGAIDTGLKAVTGEYLTLLDADDKFLPGSISKRAHFLDENPDYVGVKSNGWRVSNDSKTLFVTTEEEKKITDLFAALTNGKTNNWAGTYMLRTEVLFDCYPDRNIYPSRYGQNFQILLPVSYKRKFGFVDEPLVEYILREDSLSQVSSPEKQFQAAEKNAEGWRDIYINTVERFVKDDEERRSYINCYNAVFYRAAFYRAIQYKKDEHIKTYYKKLCSTGKATLEDRISYYNIVGSVLAIPTRLVKKLKSIFSGKKW